jgi:heptosyltransferase III
MSICLPTLRPEPAILFVTATRIGDAVLSTGLLAQLIERYPGARVTVAAGPVAAPLFRRVPGLERLITVTKKRQARHWLALWREIVLRHWDLAVDLRGSALTWAIPARHRRIGAKGDPRQHRVVQLAQLFELDPPPAPRLWLGAPERAKGEALVPAGAPVLGLGPTANWRGKEWPAQRFAALSERLTAPGAPLAGARIAVFAAPHERVAALTLIEAVPPARLIEVTGEADLLAVTAALERLTLFIGNDTGLMHMAAAMDTPTLGLFGPSPATQYAPWGPHAAVAATRIPYETLVTAPDFDHRTTGTLMESLSVETAEAAALTLLRHHSAAA